MSRAIRDPKQKRDEKPPYVPTEAERAVAADILARRQKSRPAVKFKVSNARGNVELHPDHPSKTVSSAALMHALGTANFAFSEGLLQQVARLIAGQGKVSEKDLNFAMALLQGIKPADETEALLAMQMLAIHNATINAALSLKSATMLPQQDSASNMLNKLARTFAAQVETLKKYRSTGEQNIRVQHVTVNEGGKAIVGNVRAGGGGTFENEGQSHEPSKSPGISECSAALLGYVETLPETVPGPGREGQESMPLSRGTRRGSKREGQRRMEARRLDQ